VRIVLDERPQAGGQPEAIKRVADQLSVAAQILQQWVEQARAKETSQSSDAAPPAESDTYEQVVQRGTGISADRPLPPLCSPRWR
jgi:transposase-like protein